jgi:hypothetical protein
VVAQVLNYSAFGNDQGGGGALYYYALSKCVYALHDDQRIWNPILAPKSLDLQKLDPRLITFESLYNGGATATETRYDSRRLMLAVGQLNIERLKRGWTLIYTKYCSGEEKPF